MSDSKHNLEGNLPQVRRYIANRVRNPQDIDDLVQDTMLKTLHSSQKTALQNPIAYLYSTAKTVLIDYWKKEQTTKDNHSDIDTDTQENVLSLEEHLTQRQQVNQLLVQINAMPELRKKVLLKRKVEGLSREEIAEQLGLSVEAVKKHITRAMIDLAESDIAKEK